MGFSNILALCGGLGLFLFGMKYMGAGLELAAGPKLNNLLEKLTRNPVWASFWAFSSPPACSPLLQQQSCVWVS